MTQEPQSDAVLNLCAVLRQAGRPGFDGHHVWELCLCRLILAIEPQCKTYRILECLPHSHRMLDRRDVINALAHLGYTSRPLRVQGKKLDARLLPCLFVPDRGDPQVITAIMDFHGAKGTAWVLERFEENRQPTSKFMREGSGHSWFHALLSRFKSTLVQVMATGLMLNLIALSTPLLTMMVYDRVIASGAMDILPMLAVGGALGLLFEMAFRALRSWGLSAFAARIDNIVGNQIFAHLIGLPPALIERASVASQISRIKTFEAVRDFFSGSVFLSMLELPFILLAAIAMYLIAGPLVYVPLGMISCYGVLFYFIHMKVKTSIRLAAKATSARQQFSIETFEKIKGIRGYGLTAIWQNKYRDLSGREFMAHFRLNWLGLVAETGGHMITLIAAVITVGYGAHLIWAGAMTTGALVASMILVWRILTPFYSLCTMIPRLEQLRNSIIQVNKLMELDTEAHISRQAASLSRIRGNISLVNADLRYGDDTENVLLGVSFDVRAGDVVAVTGENGAGKSSLLKLIKGMTRLESGAVLIDGFDTRQLDVTDLRRQIAYVPQQPDFFKGTIADNLRLGNPLATDEQLQEALELADAWDEIGAMPQGVQTEVGRYTDGNVSSTLLPRLSLARAYLHAASILLIDELPNSLLNGKAGRNLRDYIAAGKGKRTVVIVTYRDDLTALADTVVTLRRGEIPTITTPSLSGETPNDDKRVA